MVGTGTHERQAERDIDGATEAGNLDGGHPHIVVGCDHGVELPAHRPYEYGIRRERTGHTRGARGRRQQLDVLPANPNDYVTAVYDDASRTLVLFGPRERLALSDELVKRFEDGGGGAGDVRIYTPELVPAEELATMIRQAIPGVASPGETGSAAATKARVIAEKAGNRLIVATPLAGQADQIEALINRLDKPVHGTGGGGAGGGTRGEVVQLTRVFRTRTADAPAVAKILTEALSRRLPSGTTVARASVSVEAGSQSIVVTGSPGDVQTATDIIAQLETGSTHDHTHEIR